MNVKQNTNICLLIVDVQNALFDNNSNALYNESIVLNNISKLQKSARMAGTPIIYVQHTEQTGSFERDSTSWEIHHSIAPDDSEPIIEKHSWDGFLNTTLHETLTAFGITTLIVCGMQTEFCLDTTLRSAYSKGYTSIVVSDAHSTFDNSIITGKQIIAHHNQIWNGRFASLIATADVNF